MSDPKKYLTIENGVVTGCKMKATSVEIPDGVTLIADGALICGQNLKSITIPDSLTEINSEVFRDCISLREIIVSENNPFYTSVDGVLYSKDRKTIVCCPRGKEGDAFIIPDGVTLIGEGAFKNCLNLKSITIPDSVTDISSEDFQDCKSLRGIIAAENNPFYTSVDGVLYSKDRKTIVCCPRGKEGDAFIIPDGVTLIGEGAFKNCRNLKLITIPDSVTEIGKSAFEHCKGLESLAIPDGVTEISDWTFGYCSELKSIVIPDSVTEIGHNAFWLCGNLKSITIPDNVTRIKRNAFWGCVNLGSLTIPDSVTEIAPDAFIYAGIREFIAAENNPVYTSVDGILYSKDKKTIAHYPGGREEYAFIIPDGVTEIGIHAFPAPRLRSVTIPDSITVIRAFAFSRCGVKSITIPNSVTAIDEFAFNHCGDLRSITVPDSVTVIGKDIFGSCSSLTRIVYKDHEFKSPVEFYKEFESLSQNN